MNFIAVDGKLGTITELEDRDAIIFQLIHKDIGANGVKLVRIGVVAHGSIKEYVMSELGAGDEIVVTGKLTSYNKEIAMGYRINNILLKSETVTKKDFINYG